MQPKALSAYLERREFASAQTDGRSFGGSAGTHVRMDGSTAIVGVLGTVLPEVSLVDEIMAELFGDQTTSSRQTADLIRKLAADPQVTGIMVAIDSHGGHSTGLADLGDAIADASKVKPVHAHAPDLAASAALWLGSQASTFTVGKTADIGSLGAYTVVNDFSKAFEAAGIKAHVISTGGVKGAGVLGTELTGAQKKDIQRNIDTLGEHFVEAVARGRKMDRDAVKKLATGQTWIGQEAVDLGLADAVSTETEALAALNQSKKPSATAPAPKTDAPRASVDQPKKENSMSLSTIYAKLAKGEALTAEEETLRAKAEKAIEPEKKPIEARTDVPSDVRAELAAEKAEREKLAKEVASLRASEKRKGYLAEADGFKFVPGLSRDEIADELAAADLRGEDAGKRIRTHFKSTHEAMASSAMMQTFGSARAGDSSPMGQLKAKAADLRAKDSKLTEAQALDLAGRQNPDLYNAVRAAEEA